MCTSVDMLVSCKGVANHRMNVPLKVWISKWKVQFKNSPIVWDEKTPGNCDLFKTSHTLFVVLCQPVLVTLFVCDQSCKHFWIWFVWNECLYHTKLMCVGWLSWYLVALIIAVYEYCLYLAYELCPTSGLNENNCLIDLTQLKIP